MKNAAIDIYHVCMNEFKLVFSDMAVILIFFVVPLAYPLLYGFIYNNEVVREAKMVVVDKSHSSASREFIRKVDASPDVKIEGITSDMEEAQEAIRRKEAYGMMYIPDNFSRNIHTMQQAQVLVYSDMSSLLFYKSFVLAATEVSLEMGADIRVGEMGYGTRAQDATVMQTVENEWIPLYNTQNGFASFLMPAILILILQQTLLLGVGTLVGTHNDKKRFTVASHSYLGKNISALHLTIGKAICYSSIYLIIGIWMLRIVPYLFHLPQIGNPLVIMVFLIPYLLASAFFAMTLSYFVSQREFAMILFAFTSLPFLFISGISWPWTAIPPALQAIGYIIPSTPAIHAFAKVSTMGASLADIQTEYLTMWLHAVVYCIFATLMYKWWIVNYDPVRKGR
jgi:ABC-2 type transport system permease protein